jgi:protein-S-isoprenylcysteine O-methyltransferase Ste14
MRMLELRVPPVPLAVLFAAAMSGLARLTPSAHFVAAGSRVAALGLAIFGAVLALAGFVSFRANKTTVNPVNPTASSTVVSTGVYRFSRNPMYLGFLLALTGWAVYVSNVFAFLLLPAFVAYMNRFQIQPEEQALLAKFGPRFEQYMAAVRRWM